MNYYTACNTAESTLDEIDAILADAWQLSDTDTAAVFTEIETQLTALDSREQLQLSMDFTQSEPTVSYAVAIDDKQNLCVTLTLTAAPAKGEAYYRISQWQVQSSGEWKGDQTLNLMK